MAHQVYGRAGPLRTNFCLGKAPSSYFLVIFLSSFRPVSDARTPPLDSPPIPRVWRFWSDAGRTFCFAPPGLPPWPV